METKQPKPVDANIICDLESLRGFFTMDKKDSLTFSFDIGHSSIGWAVIGQRRPEPQVIGCGTVIFPKDDCLASQRRSYRRARRNIRSTRQRVARLRLLLAHLGVLPADVLDGPGHPAPHALAARALLSAEPSLSWQEMWQVLRWYAHNRGYDGNARWSRSEPENSEDTEKEKAAVELMRTHGTESMAETICAVLGVDPRSRKHSSHLPFKTLNAAFPRSVVRREVLAILAAHQDHLPCLDQQFIDCLVEPAGRDSGGNAWRSVPVPGIKLPKRYFGGLLFGQFIPRFDNRIIAACPISGEKVPNKACRDFLRYRWAMIVANLRAGGKPLSVEVRQQLNAVMQNQGRLTATELRKEIERLTGAAETNIKAYFDIHPDAADALILDPALALFNGARGAKAIGPFWQHLPDPVRNRALGRWRKGRKVDLGWMLAEIQKSGGDPSPLFEEIDRALEDDQKKIQKKKKPQFLSRDHLLRRAFAPDFPSGRAPYSRAVMRKVWEFVFSTGRHPAEAEGGGNPAGPIYRSEAIIRAERHRPVDKSTNNHLVRHRLLILLRLADDMIAAYAGGDALRVSDIVVEVARDLQEFSGLTAKEMAGELTKRLSHFKAAVKYLEEHAPDLPVTGSLIRKCRVAMDLGWTCPFTGNRYDARKLPEMEREHIIPFADRPTNSLDAVVLTFDWVNKMKGKRTALQFINEVAGDGRFFTPNQYAQFVDGLKVARRETYPDDFRRQSARKKWLMVERYEGKDHGFTAGALTQTSHLNRLSARQLEKRFEDPATGSATAAIHSVPGQVTAEIRKAWNMLHTLDRACPECAGRTKTEIREITHLHHALDAATLALAHHYLPGSLPGQAENEKGAIWQAMLKRRKSPEEIALLMRTGVFKTCVRNGQGGDAVLVDLPKSVKDELASRLAECRVVQHIPADQSGARLELNPWRVAKIHGDANDPEARVELAQRQTVIDRGRRVFKRKTAIEKARRVIGLKPGKLAENKSVLVIAENFGVALDPDLEVLPFQAVPLRLRGIKQANGGASPRILRNGMLIRILSTPPQSAQDYTGIWRVSSVKDNSKAPALDFVRPAYIKAQNGVIWAGINKTLAPLLKAGLEIVEPTLIGTDSSSP